MKVWFGEKNSFFQMLRTTIRFFFLKQHSGQKTERILTKNVDKKFEIFF